MNLSELFVNGSSIDSFFLSISLIFYLQAAWYPDYPTHQDETTISNFFSALARFYPCTWCADDFKLNLQTKPIQ